jgi:hypothetical protein
VRGPAGAGGARGGGEPAAPRREDKRANPRWPELRAAFLTLVRMTGNARAAARVLGEPNMFNNRRRKDAAFRAEWDAARAAAGVELGAATRAFPGAPPVTVHPLVAGSAEELGGFLRPGRKAKQAAPEPVIRRTRGGRPQITFARDGHMTADSEAAFVARLAASGNFNASARAIGFQPASLRDRVVKWPAFAKACEEALATAEIALDHALVAHAHMLLRTGGDPGDAGAEEEALPFDPVTAMRILGFLDARRGGRTSAGRRKGPPGRSFEEAVESVLAKIRAIEAHKNQARQSGPLPRVEGGGEDGSSCPGGGDGL